MKSHEIEEDEGGEGGDMANRIAEREEIAGVIGIDRID